MSAPGRWQPMQADDLEPVIAVAALVHPDYPEPASAFAERLQLFPAGSRVLRGDAGEVLGYLQCFPWRGAAPPLGAPLGRLPDSPDRLHLHDLALLPAARGGGAGRAALGIARAAARRAGLPAVSIVALPAAAAWWRAAGFRDWDGKGAPSCYGTGARAMRLTPP